MDLAFLGKKIKELYPSGISGDGRKYSDIPDQELGQKYIINNGVSKALDLVEKSDKFGKIANPTPDPKVIEAQAQAEDEQASMDLYFSNQKAVGPNYIQDLAKKNPSLAKKILGEQAKRKTSQPNPWQGLQSNLGYFLKGASDTLGEKDPWARLRGLVIQ